MNKFITYLCLLVCFIQNVNAKEYEGIYEDFALDLVFPEHRRSSDAVYAIVRKDVDKFYDLLPSRFQYNEDEFVRNSLNYISYSDGINLILSSFPVYAIDKSFKKETGFPNYPNGYSFKNRIDYLALMQFNFNEEKFEYSHYPVRRGDYLDFIGIKPHQCLVAKSMALQDINLDGIPEVFIFGGGGGHSRAYRGAGMNRWMDFYIFSLKGLKPIFYSRAKFESYAHNDNLEYIPGEVGGVRYQSVTMSGFYLDSAKRNEVKQGIQTEARYFFGDFNKDDVLDIIVWDQRHLSRKVDDPKKGYYLDEEQFLFYSNQSGGFKSLDLPKEEIRNMLKEHGLSWEKGFPKKGVECK